MHRKNGVGCCCGCTDRWSQKIKEVYAEERERERDRERVRVRVR